MGGGTVETAAAAAAGADPSTAATTSNVTSNGHSNTVDNNDEDNTNSGVSGVRQGTISSARFNILSTMVGGGSLSLPMAFQKSGNGLVGPSILIFMAILTEFVFRIHVGSARLLSPVSPTETKVGTDSFESISSAAFGTKIHGFSKVLVTAMCFFGTVGYAVLLRDMLQPITDHIWNIPPEESISGPLGRNNLSMATVALLTTPLCTLKTLTSLERFGAASMFSVFILGFIVVYRSAQCNMGTLPSNIYNNHHHNSGSSWTDSFQLLPNSWQDVLDAFPLFVSCFVCHYNLAPVHNELQQPTPSRVTFWLRSTLGVAFLFYFIMGIAGSAYGQCTPSGKVQGNVLLDFAENDPLLLVGRMCLAITITLAFPMLTIPARDIVLRSWTTKSTATTNTQQNGPGQEEEDDDHYQVYRIESIESDNVSEWRPVVETVEDEDPDSNSLSAPLLPNEHRNGVNANINVNTGKSNTNVWEEAQAAVAAAAASSTPATTTTAVAATASSFSFGARLTAAIAVFWTAIFVASCVKSIDVVWDLLGSSLSMLLSFVIPCGSYLVIVKNYNTNRSNGQQTDDQHDEDEKPTRWSKFVAWCLVLASLPLMVLSTANAVDEIFFPHDDSDDANSHDGSNITNTIAAAVFGGAETQW